MNSGMKKNKYVIINDKKSNYDISKPNELCTDAININDWNNYAQNIKFLNISVPNKLKYIFSVLHMTKIQKLKIKDMIESPQILELMSKQFCLNNYTIISNSIKEILNVLNIKIVKYFDYVVSKPILSYLYFSSQSILEKIHPSYFDFDYLLIIINKCINVKNKTNKNVMFSGTKKIIDIINWNFLHRTDDISKIVDFYSEKLDNNNPYHIIIHDYLVKSAKHSKLTNLSPKYSSIIKKTTHDNMQNYTPEVIINILTNPDEKNFLKMLSFVKPHVVLNSIQTSLQKQNISESRITMVLNLLDKKYRVANQKNRVLFSKLIVNAYIYCINNLWPNYFNGFTSHASFNYPLNIIKNILTNYDEKVFTTLVNSGIIDVYLCKKDFGVWYWILSNSNNTNAIKILVKEKYEIPKYFFSILFKKIHYSHKYYDDYTNIYNSKLSLSNICKHIKMFDIPINDENFEYLIGGMSNDEICNWMEKNLNRICIEKVIGTILSNKNFKLLEQILKMKYEDFNTMTYRKNFRTYLKYVSNPLTLLSVYNYNIIHHNCSISKKIIKYALVCKNTQLIKQIIKKSIPINIDLIAKYFFNVSKKHLPKGMNIYDYRRKFMFNSNNPTMNNIYNMLKNYIHDWNKIYSYNNIKDIMRLIPFNYSEWKIITSYLNAEDISIMNIIDYKCNFEDKIKILVDYFTNVKHEYILTRDEIRKILFFLHENANVIDNLDEFDKKTGILTIIKPHINNNVVLEILICDDTLSLFSIKTLNYMGYLKPDLYINTLIILCVVGYSDINIIEYYIKSHPFLKRRTYNFLDDYTSSIKIKYNSIKRSKSKRINLSALNSYIAYDRILSSIKNNNILDENLELNNGFEEISNVIKNNNDIMIQLQDLSLWAYDAFPKTDFNDIMKDLCE